MKKLGFFSEQLAESMARQKLTATLLSQRVRCSYEYIRRMLDGQSLPSLRLLRRLSAKLGWNEKEMRRFVMMDQARGKFGDAFWIVLGKNPQCDSVYILWEFLTPEERDFFADFARFLVERKQRKEREAMNLVVNA